MTRQLSSWGVVGAAALLSLLLTSPSFAGDANVDAMQREIIRLSQETKRLRAELREARQAAPLPAVDDTVEQVDKQPAEEQTDEPVDKPAKRPAKRAAAPRAMPETRDCPRCSRGKVYGPATIAVPVYSPAWGWMVSYHSYRAPIGACTACGGTGRLPNSLAGR